MWKFHLPVSLFLALSIPTISAAGEMETEPPLSKSMLTSESTSLDFPFHQGMNEFQVMTGPFLHLKPTGNPRPRTEFVQVGLRYGWMLNSPGNPGLLRGNLEFLIEAFGAGIYQGPGSYLAGADLMVRYNFVQPDARLIPYLQVLGGGLYNDVYETRTQGLLDTAGEFYLGADLGLRWMISPDIALEVEVGYRHISNAGAGEQNLGLNSLGGTLGISCFFR